MNFANSIVRQAENCCAEQRWERAEHLFRAAVEQDPSPAHRVALGAFLAERQHYHAAIGQLMPALDAAQNAGDLQLQAVIFADLAAIYRELGEPDLARRFQRQVLALKNGAGAEELLAWSSDALLAGKLTLAEQLARQAFEFAEDVGDIELQSDACGTLGVIAAREGHARRAVWLLIRAARGHQQVQDDHGLGVDYQNLAEICGVMDRLVWQRRFFQAAEDCFERAGRMRSQIQVGKRQRAVERLLNYRGMVADRN